MIEEGDMKRRTVFGLIMILIGLGLIIYAGISATIFRFQNIDMTDMRLFIESILFLYLYDEKHSFNEINSKQFIIVI